MGSRAQFLNKYYCQTSLPKHGIFKDLSPKKIPTASASASAMLHSRYTQVKELSHDHHESHSHSKTDQDRAPSTAEEFMKLAEDKATHQGFASQTSEKVLDGLQEAISSDSEVVEESVKDCFKEKSAGGGGNFHKPNDEKAPPPPPSSLKPAEDT